MTTVAVGLFARGKEQFALEATDIRSELVGLLAFTRVTQAFRNRSESNVEAVYTFPAPPEASFLDLEVKIGDRSLHGAVVEAGKADLEYEEAVEDGNTAILLREVSAGLYSVSLANIMPGEAIELRYSFAQILSWQGDSLRLTIPMTIAPHYGDPASMGLKPHEEIQHSYRTGATFSLEVSISGELSACEASSPSHTLAYRRKGDRSVVLVYPPGSAMDRDFVLLLSSQAEIPSEGVLARDGDGWVAHAGAYVPTPKGGREEPGVYKLVIDCSGSMGGDSITHARAAAMLILDSLDGGDRFNITAFGSHHKTLFPRPQSVTDNNLQSARDFVSQLDADMGGTEMLTALRAANDASSGPEEVADLLLVTDGQSSHAERIISECAGLPGRVFTVGVGASVSQGLVQRLARETGGACELVSPGEEMAGHILRHFERMRQPMVSRESADWGATTSWELKVPGTAVFAGDTRHLVAGFSERPPCQLNYSAKYALGKGSQEVDLQVGLVESPSESMLATQLPRVLAALRLKLVDEKQALAIALQYQLLSTQTKYLLVHEREEGEKAIDLPSLQIVDHQLPAGWGGIGSVLADITEKLVGFDEPCSADYVDFDFYSAPPRRQRPSKGKSGAGEEYFDIPAFLRRESPVNDRAQRTKQKERLATVFDGTPLERLGLTTKLVEKLEASGIRKVEDLLGVPRAALQFRLNLTDTEMAELLRGLRELGIRLR